MSEKVLLNLRMNMFLMLVVHDSRCVYYLTNSVHDVKLKYALHFKTRCTLGIMWKGT